MEPLPLLPQINSKTCPDTTQIIREEFQEILQAESFPKKIAKNLKKYKVDTWEYKKFKEVDEIYEASKTVQDQIGEAEKRLMKSQAEYLVKRDVEGPLPNVELLSMPRMFETQRDIIEKYNLIQYKDILPNISERLLDYRFRIFRSRERCPVASAKLKTSNEFPFIKTHLPENLQNITVTPERKIKKYKTNAVYKTEKKKFSNLKQIDGFLKNNRTDEEKIEDDKIKNVAKTGFMVKPTCVIFLNFEINIQYEKSLFVYNTTNKAQSMSLPELAQNSAYTVRLASQGSRIAPGMSCKFVIGFKTESLNDVMEMMLVKTPCGKNIKVKIISHRETPILKGFVYEPNLPRSLKVPKEISSHSEAMNYCIDCDTTLLGYCTEVGFKLKSCGIPGRYFIISEEDWEFSEIKDITDDLHLHLDCFHLYPNYFELNTDEEIDLQIFFHPDSEGLHTDKVFVVCDNNSIIELDLVGDCLIYKNNFFQFRFPQAPHHIEKGRCDPEYSLHLGPVYYKQKVMSIFSITNNSPLKIKYAWKKKPAKLKDRKNVKNMEDDWIRITPSQGIFHEDTDHEFKVDVVMKSNKCGLYSYVLCLYVCDIPSMSLSEGPLFEYDEEYFADGDPDSPELLSLLVAKVEVQVRNMKLPVYITPNEINLGTILYGQKMSMDNVMVFNDGYQPVTCQWIYPKECSCPGCKGCTDCYNLKFKERKFIVTDGHFVNCQLYICPSSYDDIDEIIQLSINDGYACRPFRIIAEIQKPLVTVTHRIIDFGYVRTLLEVKETILVYNGSDLPLRWTVFEFVYNPGTKEMEETDCYCYLSCDAGSLCHKGSYCNFEYTLDTSVPRLWFSILIFYTLFNNPKTGGTIRLESAHTLILADIRAPKITITVEDGTPWILQIKDNLYVGIPKSFTVYIENDSMVDVPYKWGTPCGDDEGKIGVKINETSGTIPRLSRKEVSIEITPIEYGSIDHLFVPLEVEGLKDISYLEIKGFVQCLKVKISLPDEEEVFKLIHWPVEVDKSVESFYIGDAIAPEGEEEDTDGILPPSMFEFDISEPKITAREMQDTVVDIPSIHFESEIGECVSEIYDLNTPEEQECTPTPSTQKTTSLMSVISFFGSEATIHENIVEFSAVPLSKPIKKTFLIENITEIPTDFKIICSKLGSRETPKEEGVDDVLYEMKWKTRDEFKENLTEHGIVVIPKPEKGLLGADSTVSIEVWVYAETWGAYLEEIGVVIGDLPVFYFNLLIEILGIPLEYPLFPNANDVESVIDFGNFLPMSDPVRRIFRFVNTSNIPLCVIWHVFDESDSCYNPPFSIFYDVMGVREDGEGDDIKMVIRVEKFQGFERRHSKHRIFEITPKETYVKPKQTGQVTIQFDPDMIRRITSSKNLKSVMVGHVYIEEKYRIMDGIYTRPPDQKFPMLKLHLTAKMVRQMFQLCDEDSTEVTLSVNDAVKHNKWTIQMRVLIKNISKARVSINLITAEPFQITRVRTLHCDQDYKLYPDSKCEVGHNECIEVFITCQLTNYLISYVSRAMYNSVKILKSITFLHNNMARVDKLLKIFANSYLVQEFPLTLLLPFPNMCTSCHYLEFEDVYIGSVKKKTLRLINKITCNSWFKCTCVDQFYKKSTCFWVEPDTGVLPPARRDVESLTLTVYFGPRVPSRMEEVLVIESCVKDYILHINLYGTGTIDEKYHIPTLKKCM